MISGLHGASGALETKFTTFDARIGLGAGGRIEGYASLFDAEDASGDVVARGAFAASLAGGARGVKLLWQHDAAQPIGVWESVVEDERGLRVSGRLLAEVRRGAEAAALLRAGAIDGLSIGYRTKKAAALPGGKRKLIEIELWEVSLVTFPMLPDARADAGADPEGAEPTDGADSDLLGALGAVGELFKRDAR